MISSEKSKIFSRLLGSESEVFSAKFFIHCFSGKKLDSSAVFNVYFS